MANPSSINFPNSSSPLVHIGSPGQIDGTLTQTGQYLLQALWNAVFNPPTPPKSLQILAGAKWIAGSPITFGTSSNIASMVRTGTGTYVVTFSSPMTDANYIVLGTSEPISVNAWVEAGSQSVNGFTLSFLSATGTLADPGGGFFVVIDLAEPVT